MNILNDKAISIIKNMVITELPKIKVKSGLCRINFRCHLNAVHDALENKENTIAMCFHIEHGKNKQPIIHFINVNKKGKYIDNTLGYWSKINDYYLVRLIKKQEFLYIENIFGNYRKELNNKLPFIVRILSNVTF